MLPALTLPVTATAFVDLSNVNAALPANKSLSLNWICVLAPPASMLPETLPMKLAAVTLPVKLAPVPVTLPLAATLPPVTVPVAETAPPVLMLPAATLPNTFTSLMMLPVRLVVPNTVRLPPTLALKV